MSLKAIIDIIRTDGGSWLVIIFVLSVIIQIAPIKIDPWTSLIKWLGNLLNGDLLEEVASIKRDFKEHMAEHKADKVATMRADLEDFINSCTKDKTPHKKSEYDTAIRKYDEYEAYCENNGIANGVLEVGMQEVRLQYSECLHNNSFLPE